MDKSTPGPQQRLRLLARVDSCGLLPGAEGIVLQRLAWVVDGQNNEVVLADFSGKRVGLWLHEFVLVSKSEQSMIDRTTKEQ